mgnify:CR=1 FL=1
MSDAEISEYGQYVLDLWCAHAEVVYQPSSRRISENKGWLLRTDVPTIDSAPQGSCSYLWVYQHAIDAKDVCRLDVP